MGLKSEVAADRLADLIKDISNNPVTVPIREAHIEQLMFLLGSSFGRVNRQIININPGTTIVDNISVDNVIGVYQINEIQPIDYITPIVGTLDPDLNDPNNIRHPRSIDGRLVDVNFNQTAGTSQGAPAGATTTNLPYWVMDVGLNALSFENMEIHLDNFNPGFGSDDMRLEASNDINGPWDIIEDHITSGSSSTPTWYKIPVDPNISTQYRYWRLFIYQGRHAGWFATNEFRFTTYLPIVTEITKILSNTGISLKYKEPSNVLEITTGGVSSKVLIITK